MPELSEKEKINKVEYEPYNNRLKKEERARDTAKKENEQGDIADNNKGKTKGIKKWSKNLLNILKLVLSGGWNPWAWFNLAKDNKTLIIGLIIVLVIVNVFIFIAIVTLITKNLCDQWTERATIWIADALGIIKDDYCSYFSE